MLISQIEFDGRRAVMARNGTEAALVRGTDTVYRLALDAIAAGMSIEAMVGQRGLGQSIDVRALAADGAFLSPIDHPDPAHLYLTGTGLTHLGSAATRDAMHAETAEDKMTDSMRMFRMGLEAGKPPAGEVGVQPEWFYKGNGYTVASPGASLARPGFAEDGGEEPEIAGIYVIAADSTPFRVGWALANEFSDHAMERRNYLYLAHSKLRAAAFGPEILLGDLPDNVRGESSILRGGEVVWQKPFLSGEANMSHSLANLEHHHFKYRVFRQPGDVHVHMFGTATLSFADDISPRPGDVFRIEAAPFGMPLENTLSSDTDTALVRVESL